MMTEEEVTAAIARVGEAALAETGQDPMIASVILVDALACILVTRLHPTEGPKVAAMFAQHIQQQVDSAIGTGEVRQ